MFPAFTYKILSAIRTCGYRTGCAPSATVNSDTRELCNRKNNIIQLRTSEEHSDMFLKCDAVSCVVCLQNAVVYAEYREQQNRKSLYLSVMYDLSLPDLLCQLAIVRLIKYSILSHYQSVLVQDQDNCFCSRVQKYTSPFLTNLLTI